ncbi:MAG TPA: ribbon-helix-helix domain-containing protein [Thermodesulfobacteriota bacterium]|nr:ribbon-helix-helix domain-containing protein [Thermodesulfobacteriota bacterium]
MKTVQMTLDEDLVNKVDKLVKKLDTTRSEFTRNALREAIRKYNISKLEDKHTKGYKNHPISKDEFEIWENEQVWGDE